MASLTRDVHFSERRSPANASCGTLVVCEAREPARRATGPRCPSVRSDRMGFAARLPVLWRAAIPRVDGWRNGDSTKIECRCLDERDRGRSSDSHWPLAGGGIVLRSPLHGCGLWIDKSASFPGSLCGVYGGFSKSGAHPAP